MAWYNPFSKKPVDVEEKLNPIQQYIGVQKNLLESIPTMKDTMKL